MGSVGDQEIETKSLFVQKTIDFLKVDGIFDIEEISLIFKGKEVVSDKWLQKFPKSDSHRFDYRIEVQSIFDDFIQNQKIVQPESPKFLGQDEESP